MKVKAKIKTTFTRVTNNIVGTTDIEKGDVCTITKAHSEKRVLQYEIRVDKRGVDALIPVIGFWELFEELGSEYIPDEISFGGNTYIVKNLKK